MKIIVRVLLLLISLSIVISAQQTSFQDTLLDRLVGNWTLNGKIDGQEVTHDLTISWILEHQYIQISEISREKDLDGTSAYESLVFIGWDSNINMYDCLWLDVTGGGGLTGEGIGHAVREGDEIPFIFKMPSGNLFYTTFIYERKTDTWKWTMDGEKDGKLKLFARVRLTRKK